MADNFGSVILDAFFAGQQNKMRREQLEQQKVQQQQQTELQRQRQQEQMRQFEEQQKMRNEQFQVKTDLEKTMMKLKEIETKSNIIKGVAESSAKGFGTATDVNPETGVPSLVVPTTPQAAGNLQAEVTQPVRDAETEAKLTIDNNATANNITEAIKTEEVKQPNRLALEATRNKNRKELLEMQQKGQINLESIRNSFAIGRLKTAAELKKAVDKGEVGDDVDLMTTGDFTVESLRNFGYSPAQKQAAAMAAKKAGVKILTEKQVAGVQNLQALQGIVEKVKKLEEDIGNANALEKAGKLIPDWMHKTQLEVRRDQLTIMVGTILKQIGNDTGTISDQDVERGATNFPDINITPLGRASNKARMQAFEEDMNNNIRKVLAIVPSEEQRYELAKRFNIKLPTEPNRPDRIKVR